MSGETTTIVFCNCGHAKIISDDVKAQILRALNESGVQFQAVQDLCELAANKAPILQQWAGAEELKIIACFPRAVKWLLNAGGYPLPDNRLEVFNMRTEAAEDIISSVLDDTITVDPAGEVDLAEKGNWAPWFPVIDYDLCNNCKQCMNFCLFGVYGVAQSGQVEVHKPTNCKTNCPACARICPSDAIIFPKHESAPINGSQRDPSPQSKPNKLDIEELVKSDVHELLRRRSAGQGENPLTADDIQKALKERQGCCSEDADCLTPAIAAPGCGGECECQCDCSTVDDAAAQATPQSSACPCDCDCHNDNQEREDFA